MGHVRTGPRRRTVASVSSRRGRLCSWHSSDEKHQRFFKFSYIPIVSDGGSVIHRTNYFLSLGSEKSYFTIMSTTVSSVLYRYIEWCNVWWVTVEGSYVCVTSTTYSLSVTRLHMEWRGLSTRDRNTYRVAAVPVCPGMVHAMSGFPLQFLWVGTSV